MTTRNGMLSLPQHSNWPLMSIRGKGWGWKRGWVTRCDPPLPRTSHPKSEKGHEELSGEGRDEVVSSPRLHIIHRLPQHTHCPQAMAGGRGWRSTQPLPNPTLEFRSFPHTGLHYFSRSPRRPHGISPRGISLPAPWTPPFPILPSSRPVDGACPQPPPVSGLGCWHKLEAVYTERVWKVSGPWEHLLPAFGGLPNAGPSRPPQLHWQLRASNPRR